MPKRLHDDAVRRSLESRVRALRADAPRKWGSMTVDQMLWHVNQFLEASLGDVKLSAEKLKMPAPLMRFFLIYMPWPKGAPTHPQARAKAEHDFEAERLRCLALIDRFVKKPIDEQWPADASFGSVTGTFASRLHAKHLDHHLRQFGA